MKWLALMVSVTMIFCQGCFPVLAQETGEIPEYQEPQTIILQGLALTQETIDISSFQLSITEGIQLYTDLLRQHPELFYVGRDISYTYAHDGILLELYPSYLMTGEALDQAREVYIQNIQQFQDRAYQIKENWLDFEKVLLIHDNLASRYSYSPQGQEIYDAYGLFTQGHGVCQAFALGFIALGQAWGLSVDMVTSASMDHAWNHVLVDNSYYHVDVTRDLPNDDQDIRHDRCLLSDKSLQALGYESYSCASSHTCSQNIFDDESQVHLFLSLTGEIYPFQNIWLGNLPSHGLATMEVLENHIQIKYTLDVNLDGCENITDLMLCRLKTDIPLTYLDMFRHKLLLTYIKETAPKDAVSFHQNSKKPASILSKRCQKPIFSDVCMACIGICPTSPP